MTKILILPLVAGALLATSVPSEAGFRFGGSRDGWKQQQMLKEEFRRAREVGGYNDPITALMNLLNGTATERDIRPGVNHISDVPGYGTIRLRSRHDD